MRRTELGTTIRQQLFGGQAFYRLFIKNRAGTIVGRTDFDAADETEAIISASVIYDACCDIAFGYEVWNGDRLILYSQVPVISGNKLQLADHQQQIIIDTEVALRDSQWLIAESKKLIEHIDMLSERWRITPASRSSRLE